MDIAKQLALASKAEMELLFANLPPEAKALIYDVEGRSPYEREQIMAEGWARGGLMAIIASIWRRARSRGVTAPRQPASRGSDDVTRRRLLLDLPRGACVWPTGDLDDPRMTWCGEPVEDTGAPYCRRGRSISTDSTEQAHQMTMSLRMTRVGAIASWWRGAATSATNGSGRSSRSAPAAPPALARSVDG